MSRFDRLRLKAVWMAPVILAAGALPVFGTGNGYLRLAKAVDNSNGGQAAAIQWTTTATGPVTLTGAGGVPATWVPPGDYALSETGDVYGYTNGSGYDCVVTPASSSSSNTLTNVTSIHVNIGDVIVCTIVNRDNPVKLKLIKKVSNRYGGVATPGQWETVALGPGPLELSGPGGFSYQVGPGVWTLSERGTVPGYTNGTSYDCVLTPLVGAATHYNNVTSITLGVGDAAVCTITNSDDLLAPPPAVPSALDSTYLVRYASNLTAGDSVVNITNTGANGNNLFGPGYGVPAGNICVNVYAFSPDEQMVSCCSCLVTPNGLVHVTANNDLVSNTLTGIRPNSIVIKLVATSTGKERRHNPTGADTDAPSYSGSSCTNSAAQVGTNFPVADAGLLAWGTTIHSMSNNDPPVGPFSITETPFLPATLDPDRLRDRDIHGDSELASLANRCANIIGNGSSFGICRSCRLGGLGGDKQ